MKHRAWVLDEAQLRGWLDQLLARGLLVVAPVEREAMRVFLPVTRAQEVSLDPGKTRWSAKEHLFLRTEPLYSYGLRGDGVELDGAQLDDRQRVLFGLRPCDAEGFLRLDEVFLGETEDPFYGHRRRATAIVTVACEASAPECFCTGVGGSPYNEAGSDVFVVPLGETWLVRACTARGARTTAENASSWREATDSERARARRQGRRAAASQQSPRLTAKHARLLDQAFDGPVWWTLGERCLGCGLCAYVCPSCTCFDVHQEGDPWGGVQSRCWDACTFALFTRHASEHNPRPNRAARYRQRLLHKFAYTGSCRKHEIRCVGCGRCSLLCPAGMNILEAVGEVLRVSALEGEQHGAD